MRRHGGVFGNCFHERGLAVASDSARDRAYCIDCAFHGESRSQCRHSFIAQSAFHGVSESRLCYASSMGGGHGNEPFHHRHCGDIETSSRVWRRGLSLPLALSGYPFLRGGASITPGQRLVWATGGVCYFRTHQGSFCVGGAQKNSGTRAVACPRWRWGEAPKSQSRTLAVGVIVTVLESNPLRPRG